jgi:hypothetical protein
MDRTFDAQLSPIELAPSGLRVDSKRERDYGRWLPPPMGNGPHYLLGRLILPLTLIRDRPQKAALCPGQVRHFHDHFRPHPMHF